MSEKCGYNPRFSIPRGGGYNEKDNKPFPPKEPLERGPNGEFREKKFKSPLKINKGENIDISGRKFGVLGGTCKLHINKGKFSYNKNKNTILIEIEDGELKKGVQVIKIDNLYFYNEDNILKDKDNTIFLDFIKIKLDDKIITYENGKVEVKKRKKGIKGLVSRIKNNVFNIRN